MQNLKINLGRYFQSTDVGRMLFSLIHYRYGTSCHLTP